MFGVLYSIVLGQFWFDANDITEEGSFVFLYNVQFHSITHCFDILYSIVLGQFWFDANDIMEEGSFVSSDNAPLSFTNWRSSHGPSQSSPTKNCAAFR